MALLACGTLYFAAPAAFAASAYRVECPAGSYVVGFEGRAGAWVDQITPVCAAWKPSEGRFGDPQPQSDRVIGESNGGDPDSRLCPSGWAVGGTYTPYYARSPHVLHSIEFTCLPSDDNTTQTVPRSFGSTSEGAVPPLLTPSALYTCPAGTLAVGILGHSGLFVDSLELICGEAVLEHEQQGKPLGKVRPKPSQPPLLSSTPNEQLSSQPPELRSLGKVRPNPLGKVRPNPPAVDPPICQRARAALGKFNAATQAALDTQCRNAGGNPE